MCCLQGILATITGRAVGRYFSLGCEICETLLQVYTYECSAHDGCHESSLWQVLTSAYMCSSCFKLSSLLVRLVLGPMSVDGESEACAQHLLGLKELGQDIAEAMPSDLEARVCTALGEEQRRELIDPLQTKNPECDVKLY